MLYLKAPGGPRILVLETKNLEEIAKGRPLHTRDHEVLVAWTPDPEWLAAEIAKSGGELREVCRLIDESTRRPQTPLRPSHPARTVPIPPKEGEST